MKSMNLIIGSLTQWTVWACGFSEQSNVKKKAINVKIFINIPLSRECWLNLP